MAAKKKSTLAKVGTTVKDAAVTVATATNEHVLKPVGKALGLSGKKKPAQKGGAKKGAAKGAAKKNGPKKGAKKATGKK
jgi:hypothetical protein